MVQSGSPVSSAGYTVNGLGIGGAGSAGTSGGGSGGGSKSMSKSGTYFDNPQLVNQLSNALGGTAIQAAGGYNNFINNPTAHPAFVNALSGLLAQMVPGEQQQQTQLADQFRGAGNMSSGIFGNSMQNLVNTQGQQHLNFASQLLAQMYPQIAGAMMAPQNNIPGLLGALKQQQSQSQSVGGGGGGFSAGGGGSIFPPAGNGGASNPFAGWNFGGGGGGGGSGWNMGKGGF